MWIDEKKYTPIDDGEFYGYRRYKNKHNVEGIMSSSGSHFGSDIKQNDGSMRFETNIPIFVPLTCLDCRYYDSGEYGDYGSRLSGPICERNLYFPTYKGTCKSKR